MRDDISDWVAEIRPELQGSNQVVAGLEVEVGELLRARGSTLAVAESCTGGLLGSRLTDVPGSSDYFLGGVIAYHDEIKRGLLGVPADLIREYGAVSAECSLAMARGLLRLVEANIAVSITGIAGPGGGTPDKPVGTVYISLITKDLERVEYFLWQGDRTANKEQSVDAALAMLVRYLRET